MTNFLALYRGRTLNDARLLALSADPEIVGDFATRLVGESINEEDPALRELTRGRHKALKIVCQETDRH